MSVALDRPAEQLAPVPHGQYSILRAMGVTASVAAPGDPGTAELVVDAVLGCGQAGGPRGATASLIEGSACRRVLALDVPSGLELATGTLHDHHVRAESTLTLALPKEGLRAGGASASSTGTPFGWSPIVRIAEG